MIKKSFSFIRWIGNMLLSLLGFLTAPIIFPILYLLKDTFVSKTRLYWLYTDEEDGIYGAEYWRKEKKLSYGSFITAYRWCALRNPAWNLQTLLKPVLFPEVILYQKGNVYWAGKKVSAENVCVMHFVDDSGNWTHNVGKILSLKHSKLGAYFIFFEMGDKIYFRLSIAKNLFGKIWVEIQIGTTYRHLFKFKLKKIKSININL